MPAPYATDRRALERDTSVEFYTAGGPGGQHRNKTQSGVRMHHRPSGVRISATERRSQSANLEVGFERLVRALTRLNAVPKKRHATRVPVGQKRRRVENKARTGERKRARSRVVDQE